ncbi:MAG: hypothetical protein ACI8Q9_002174, partial [Planctomycetota bacterium]
RRAGRELSTRIVGGERFPGLELNRVDSTPAPKHCSNESGP